MPLIPQQDIVVVSPPYQRGLHPYDGASLKLRQALESYPPCRIVSISVSVAAGAPVFTAVIETI